MISVVSLGLSVVALIPAFDSARSGQSQADTAKSESDRRGLLEVAAVSAKFTDKLKGVEKSSGSERDITGLSGPAVDIALRNRGSGSATITKVTVNVSRSETLDTCGATGGEYGVTAHYSVEIPIGKRPPFTVSTTEDVRFEVKSGENDRFSLAIGPDSSEAGTSPWIGVVTLRLHDLDGSDLDIGPMALVSSGGDENFYPNGSSWKIKVKSSSCLRNTAQTVSEVLKLPGITASKEFAALDRALRPYR
ncbi:hypothetical protein [Streptomyces sp. NPDC058084]|uniref:hypothetical protein n=1 Tax=Streptomyces sp. NPDC058084 TaxID=3346333 RepID=UPI0036E7611B